MNIMARLDYQLDGKFLLLCLGAFVAGIVLATIIKIITEKRNG